MSDRPQCTRLTSNSFLPHSYEQLNPKHKSVHSAFETPDPGFWTANGYAVLRADEVGVGQSPGVLDTMSKSTSDAFADVIEWVSEQAWCNGKVGLVGISYFAGSQWRVAARRPKGLAAICPIDGMADYYRDRCRHGGILTGFLPWWFDRQVRSNQYGLPGKASRNWGPDTIEGDLPEEELKRDLHDQTTENAQHFYRDDPYYASRDYNLEDIVTPLLSIGNWGSIMIHLHGNYEGYRLVSSEKKFLRMIVGRHDLPFYDDENVEVQKSFLDAFLKGEDRGGWTDGTRPPVDLVLRKGNVGYNNPQADATFRRRYEHEWPLARTAYTKYYLTPDKRLMKTLPAVQYDKLSYPALGNVDNQQFVQFTSDQFTEETEITGYSVARLNVSVTTLPGGTIPTDIDLFLTLRHFGPDDQEIYYTGIQGEPVPLCKGWQRVSLRKVNKEHPRHREWLPHRDYFSTDSLPVIPGEVYPVDVEVWATNVIVEKGDRIVFEVASGDTQGSGGFGHVTPER
jgi:predicted acyl esterase